MAQYRFPAPVQDGSVWHLLYKIEYTLGVKATSVSTSGGQITVNFSVDLTTQQETDLDALISGTPYAPSFPGYLEMTGNTLYIRDLFDQVEWFNTFIASIGISGLQATMWYVPTGDNGTKKDGILLKFNKILTNSDKRKIKAAYGDNANWGDWV